jgi:hypothetical protein
MTISSFRKYLTPSLVMASVAFFGITTGARAADLTSSDPQELARRLLAGANSSAITAIAAPAISAAPGGRNASPTDSQALAQRMILGARDAAKTHTATTAAAHSRNMLE